MLPRNEPSSSRGGGRREQRGWMEEEGSCGEGSQGARVGLRVKLWKQKSFS